MNDTELIEALIRLPCPEPTRVHIESTTVGRKTFVTITPDQENITRIVGRAGATITALKLLAEAINPAAQITLLEAEEREPTAIPSHTPAEVLNALAARLRFRMVIRADRTTFAALPDALPETLSLAIKTIFRNTARHPTAPLMVQ